MTLILPNEIINNTPADAVPVDANYKTIAQYINTNLVNRDGSVAMTGQLTLVGDPVQDNQAARKAYVDALLPIGIMLPWLGVAAPAGQWGLANGAALQTTVYAELFNLLGYRYGGSGGSFNLPNMAGVVPVGQKANDSHYGTLGNYGGSSKVPVPSHVHGMNHDHPSAKTALETQLHQHPINHDHGSHDHTLRYDEIQSIAGTGGGYVPRRWADSSGTTLVDGTSTYDIPLFTGNSQSQNVKHDHDFDVPNHVGNTAAYSLEVTDPDGNKSTTDFYAPFVVINYIVRLA